MALLRNLFLLFQVAYTFLSIIIGISSFWNTTTGIALSGLIAPLICCIGGVGLRGSLYGTPGQIVAGLVLATIFLTGGLFWLYSTGFGVVIFGSELSGTAWGLIGFGVGLIFTTKQDAVLTKHNGK